MIISQTAPLISHSLMEKNALIVQLQPQLLISPKKNVLLVLEEILLIMIKRNAFLAQMALYLTIILKLVHMLRLT